MTTRTSEIDESKKVSGRPNPDWLRHVPPAAVIVVILGCLFLPVLLHGTFGTFDDPFMIIDCGRRVQHHDDMALIHALHRGLRMGIFLWSIFLWQLFPENARAFFCINYICLSAAVFINYLSCELLTRRRWLSLICASLTFVYAGLFEVIYTVDKQEIGIFLLAASGILLLLKAQKASSWKPYVLPLIAIVSAGTVTKETIAIVPIFASTWLGVCVAAMLRGPTEAARNDAKQAGVLAASCLIPVLILHLFVHEIPREQYVVVNFNPSSLLAKLAVCASAMPELFVPICLSMFTAVDAARKNQWARNDSTVLALVSTVLIVVLALAAFNTYEQPLLYIWMPLLAVLAPALALGLNKISLWLDRSHKILFPVALAAGVASIISVAILQLPVRIMQAQFQLNLDHLTQETAAKLAQRSSSSFSPVKCAVPFFDINQYEVPRNICLYARDCTTAADHPTLVMLDFMKLTFGTEPNPGELGKFRGKDVKYKDEVSSNFVGWSGYSCSRDSDLELSWTRRALHKGDWLLVPFGDLPEDSIRYRGSQVFTAPANIILFAFPQLRFRGIDIAERSVFDLTTHTSHQFGWRLYEITESAPIAAATSSDGWAVDGAKLAWQAHPGKLIRITSKQPLPASVWMSGPKGDFKINPLDVGHCFHMDFPPDEIAADGSIQSCELRFSGSNTRVHVDDLKFIDP